MSAKLAALMSTNDLPDIVTIPNGDILKGLYDAALLTPLDDLVDQYGINIKANLAVAIKATKASYADGKLYRLPVDVGLFEYNTLTPIVAPYMRWDLYKKLGAPEINTLEDYIPVLKKMMELEPKNAAGQKNYGMSIGFGGGPWDGDWNIWGGPACLYGGNCNNYSSVNKLTDYIYQPYLTQTDSFYYNILHFWYTANKAGVLDPDSFTMKSEQVNEKMKAGRAMMSFASWNAGDANTAFKETGTPEKGLAPTKLPAFCNSIWVSSDQPSGTPGSGYGISEKCKDKIAAIKFLDYTNSYDGVELIMGGIEGVHWDLVDGVPTIKPEVFKQNQSDTKYGKSQGLGFFGSLSSIAKGQKDPRYSADKDVFVQFWNIPSVNKQNMTDLQKDVCSFYNIQVPLDLVTKNANVKTFIMVSPEWPYMEIVPDDMMTLVNAVDAYCFNNFLPMILAKDEADFAKKRDAFIKGLKDVGYEKTSQWYIDAQQRAIAKMPK